MNMRSMEILGVITLESRRTCSQSGWLVTHTGTALHYILQLQLHYVAKVYVYVYE